AKLKAEVLHQHYQGRPHPLGHLLLGQIFRLNPIAAAVGPLANAMVGNPAFKWMLEKVAGIDRRRTLPRFAHDHFRKWFRRHRGTGILPVRGHGLQGRATEADPRAGTRGTVLLLDDCFTTYNDPEVGIAAVRVLEAAGYRVELAGLECCGRPAISKGLLPLARDLAVANVRKLLPAVRAGMPILGRAPSCRVTLVDEYRDSRLGDDADRVAAAAHLVDAFVADTDRVPDLPMAAGRGRVLVHGHCHQKAVLGTAGTLAALRRVPGL